MAEEVKPQIVFLRGLKTVLRPVCKETDLKLLVYWLNLPEIRRNILMQTPVSIESETKWLDSVHERPNDIVLAIETLEGKHIGNMGLHEIDRINRTATTGTIIGDADFRGKGYGTDAKFALLDYAFNTLNLHKVCSGAIAFNKHSLNYSLRCGYRVEGTLREHLFRDGKYHDKILLAVLRSDFERAYAKYLKKMRKKKAQ